MKKSLVSAIFYWLVPLILAVVPVGVGLCTDFSDSADSPVSVEFSDNGSESDHAGLVPLDDGSAPASVPYFRYRSVVSDWSMAVSVGSGPSGKSYSARLCFLAGLTAFRPVAGNVDVRLALGAITKIPRYLVLQSLLI